MSEMRNPITREENFSNPAGNVMMELQEADLNKFVAGAGETRNSGGVLCTSTAECYFGTLLKPCCPKCKFCSNGTPILKLAVHPF